MRDAIYMKPEQHHFEDEQSGTVMNQMGGNMGFTHFDEDGNAIMVDVSDKRLQKEQLMQEGLFKSIMRLLNI